MSEILDIVENVNEIMKKHKVTSIGIAIPGKWPPLLWFLFSSVSVHKVTGENSRMKGDHYVWTLKMEYYQKKKGRKRAPSTAVMAHQSNR